MKKLITITYCISFITFNLFSQIGVGEWRDHLPYNRGKGVVELNNKIYCSTESGIFIFNKLDNSIEKLSRIKGLSDLKINSIASSQVYNLLIIGYENCNIDIIQNNSIFNYPYIKNKIIIGNKTINNIYIHNQYAYISCGFGIVVYNLTKNEIKDTYQIQINNETLNINDVCIINNEIIAATDSGVFHGRLMDNLVDYSNWSRYTGYQTYNFKTEQIEAFDNKLFIGQNLNASNSIIVFKQEDNWISLYYTTNKVINSINAIDNHLAISTNNEIMFLNDNLSVESSISDYGFSRYVVSNKIYIDASGTLWIADHNFGLVSKTNNEFKNYKPNGPINNNCYKLKYLNGYLWVSGGGMTDRHQNLWRPGQFHYLKDDIWRTITSYTTRDIIDFTIDPSDPDHIYAASFGYGLLEFDNNTLINEFNLKNPEAHTLKSAIPGENYYWIGGVTLDNKKNVWMTNMKSSSILDVYTNDKKWFEIPVEKVTDIYVGEIINTKNNYKWINLLRGEGILVYNDNNTVKDLDDDQYSKFSVFDENNKTITSEVFALAEDKKGDIWVGTDMGIYVFYNAENVFKGANFYASDILIPRNDGTGLGDPLLFTETVTCIKVDGANRKWFGTKSSGVYLFSADGINQIKHFNTSNSPLLSDYIIDIEIDGATGEVFFSTSEGLMSFKSTASDETLQKNLLYAYPNPVRGDYKGPITITGLIEDANVKITDISGNIVYETVTLGGQAIWDGKTMSGNRVKTGIYLIFCTDDFGNKTKITKLLVIN